jgi:hypothetical protein
MVENNIMAVASGILRSFKALKALIDRRHERNSNQSSPPLSARLLEVFLRTWDLGLTAFGGPPVHFQIFYSRFVEGKGGSKWIDEQTVILSRHLFSARS